MGNDRDTPTWELFRGSLVTTHRPRCVGYPIWKKGVLNTTESDWLSSFFLVGLATKMDHWWFQKFDMFELFKYRNGMMIPNDALFFSEKHQADLFRSCQKFFFKFSSWSVYVLICFYISNKNDVLSQLFWVGGWVYSYLEIVLVCPESFSSFYLFAVGKSVQ